MQVVTLFNLTHVLLHSLNTMSETIISNSQIFQEFAKLKYMLNLKISKSQNLTNAKISWPKVYVIYICLKTCIRNCRVHHRLVKKVATLRWSGNTIKTLQIL